MTGESYTSDVDAWIPSPRHAEPVNEATMVLPVYAPPFATAEPISAPPAPAPVPAGPVRDRLPSDERNMLIFVSALLAAGTLAIVAMALVGR